VDHDLLARLCAAPGPSGREDRIREVVREELAPHADEVWVDPVGNLVARRRGDGPRLVLAAHMDELGFLVRAIDDRGFLRLVTLGGHDPRALVARNVIVHGREDVPGVIGSKPVHLMDEKERRQPPKTEDLYVDLGLPAERVRELVRVGDHVTRTGDQQSLGDLFTSPALDDRAGVYVMVEAFRTAAEHRCDLLAVATVQEEVGLRGARVAASRLRPAIGLALDVTLANDGPGVPDHERVTVLGEGAAIKVADSSVIAAVPVVDMLRGLAERDGIAHQMEIMPRGGTDTRELQLGGDGAVAGGVSIPLRNVHQVTEACHPGDLDACVALTAAFCGAAHALVPGA